MLVTTGSTRAALCFAACGDLLSLVGLLIPGKSISRAGNKFPGTRSGPEHHLCQPLHRCSLLSLDHPARRRAMPYLNAVHLPPLSSPAMFTRRLTWLLHALSAWDMCEDSALCGLAVHLTEQ